MDMESDQGSSIDSGRGQSDDEHNRLNSSLQGPNISFIPDPHKHSNTYPDLVNCVCGASHRHNSPISPVHSKGCPQYQSPKHNPTAKNIDNLNDFQNLLGLPPKTYNKKPQHRNSRHKINNLNVPGRQYSESSSSSSPHSSREQQNSRLSQQPLDSSYSSNTTHIPDPVTSAYTQQCYDDIARKNNNRYSQPHSSMGGTSSNSSKPHRHHHQPRKDRNSWSQQSGRDDSEGAESDGGSTTTSGSFSVVGSVENVQPLQQIHQVYV